MRRSVVAMMVLVLMMLVLVLAQADDHETFSPKTLLPILIPSAAPAQADDDHETSSRKTLVPIIPRPASISQDTPSSTDDCDTKCSAECSLAKRFPKHYAACIDHCKKLHCKYTPSYAILKCTITCVDSISPKLSSDADHHKVLNEDHIMKACYNGCKKKNNV